MEQQHVRDFMPPNVSCWRGNVRNEWWCHVKPYKRHLESLERHGGDEQSCIHEMVKQAWTKYLEKEALPQSACPFDGIF